MTTVPPEELTLFGKVMRGVWAGLLAIGVVLVGIPVAIWRSLTLKRP